MAAQLPVPLSFVISKLKAGVEIWVIMHFAPVDASWGDKRKALFDYLRGRTNGD
jgi:hypothetical protein